MKIVTNEPNPVLPGIPPFDATRLDLLMHDANIDVIVATSRHNTRYLLGGYSYFFFSGFDALGTSRYLPIVIYFRNRPADAVYLGNSMEYFEHELGKFWTPEVHTRSWNSIAAIEAAVSYVRHRAVKGSKIGIEPAFIPYDAATSLISGLHEFELVDAQRVLELLRSIKSERELLFIKEASDRVVDSMLAVITSHGPGCTKNDLVKSLAAEETRRDLTYEYCLISAGSSLNRSPSNYELEKGEIYSLDSGGNYRGYLGDLCRMAILGQPDAELEDLMGDILEIQAAARSSVGEDHLGRDICDAAEARIAKSPHREYIDFIAHGMGLISHETPRLSDSLSYPPDDASLPQRRGMVFSIETAIKHPKRGFIKIEDTLAITHTGCIEAYGDSGRSWNQGRT